MNPLHTISLLVGLALIVLPPLTYILHNSLSPLALYSGVALILFFYRLVKDKDRVSLPKWDVLTILAIGIFFAFLAQTAQKYPIFPPAFSGDWLFYPKLIAKGEISLLDQPFYTVSKYFIMAFLNPNDILSTYRPAIMSFTALSPFIVYFVADSILPDPKAKFATVLTYILFSPLWFHLAFSTGLLAFFYSAMLTLFAYGLIRRSSTWPFWAWMPLLLITGTITVLSHFTAPIFFLALWSSIPLRIKHDFQNYATRVLTFSLIPMIGLSLLQDRFPLSGLLSMLQGGAGDVYRAQITPTITFLGQYATPFMALQAIILQAPFLPFFVIASIAGATASCFLNRNRDTIFFLIWFFLVWAISSTYSLGWRGVLASDVPMILILPLGLVQIFRVPWSRLSKRSEWVKVKARGHGVRGSKYVNSTISKNKSILKFAVLIIIGSLMIYGGHFGTLLADSTYKTQESNLVHMKVLDALHWAHKNAHDKQFVTVSDWRFRFFEVYQFTRAIKFDPFAAPQKITRIDPKAWVFADSEIAKPYVASKLYEAVYENGFVVILRPRGGR